MELYVKTYLNNNLVEQKVSLFGDEEIELTKNWNDRQALDGYGSYSTQFTVPIDANNSEIFKYYDQIGSSLQLTTNSRTANKIDPSYFLSARIIVNEYEILGNIALQSFSYKKQQRYAYNLVFYAEEKNLVKDLNASQYPKLNDVVIDDLKFTFNYENVIDTWTNDRFHFVPLMAMNRPLIYRNTYDYFANNINSNYTTSTGVLMTDLAVGYKLKTILEQLLSKNGFNLTYTSNVEDFLTDLYIMPNTKVEYAESLTSISGEITYSNLYNNFYNIFTWDKNLADNDDILSYDTTTNIYTVKETGRYIIDVSTTNINFMEPISSVYGSSNTNFRIVDIDTNTFLTTVDNEINTLFDISGGKKVEYNLTQNQKIKFLFYYAYTYSVYDENQNSYIDSRLVSTFDTNEVKATLKIQQSTDKKYDYDKRKINWPDIYISEFLVNFCKSFNIFFTYNNKDVKLYFKDNLPYSIYDLSNYLILDKDYTFNHSQKYKMIDYMFAEGKDINNIDYKKGNGTGIAFGEYKQVFDYEVGIDKLEFKSVFTVFPRTELNITDNENVIRSSTKIPLHTELNESNGSLNTDYLIFYKSGTTVNTSNYNLQNSAGPGFTPLNYAPDYGPNGPKGYTLDYNILKIIPDNITTKYETNLDLLLPPHILYKIKIYDRVVIQGVWYEIVSMTINIKTGYTKIKLKTL